MAWTTTALWDADRKGFYRVRIDYSDRGWYRLSRTDGSRVLWGALSPEQRKCIEQAVADDRPKRGVAFVDEAGMFHCPCGRTHSRGPINGVDAYRCLRCGKAYRVSGVAEVR